MVFLFTPFNFVYLVSDYFSLALDYIRNFFGHRNNIFIFRLNPNNRSMENIRKCGRCGKNYNHEGIFRNAMKKPLRYWCMQCINEHTATMFGDDGGKKEGEEKFAKTNKVLNIDWSNTKNAIIAILIIVIGFALLIALKRDYGKRDNYPIPRPLDETY